MVIERIQHRILAETILIQDHFVASQQSRRVFYVLEKKPLLIAKDGHFGRSAAGINGKDYHSSECIDNPDVCQHASCRHRLNCPQPTGKRLFRPRSDVFGDYPVISSGQFKDMPGKPSAQTGSRPSESAQFVDHDIIELRVRNRCHMAVVLGGGAQQRDTPDIDQFCQFSLVGTPDSPLFEWLEVADDHVDRSYRWVVSCRQDAACNPGVQRFHPAPQYLR